MALGAKLMFCRAIICFVLAGLFFSLLNLGGFFCGSEVRANWR